jgi:hypothetical protein
VSKVVAHSSGGSFEPRTEAIDKIANRSPSCTLFTPPHSNSLENAPASKSLQLPSQRASMANFVVDLNPFVPLSMFLEDGGPNHRVRTSVYFSGVPTKTHEEFTIAITNGKMTIAQHHQLMHDLSQYIVQEGRSRNATNSCMTLASTLFKRFNFRFGSSLCTRTRLGSLSSAMLVRGLP